MYSWRIIAGALLIVLGVAWLFQVAGIVHFPSDIIGPLGLIAIGIALAAGAPRGLHVPLFVAGIILAIVLAGDEGVRHRTRDETRAASQTVTPTTASELHPYRLGAGTLAIDLTRLPLDDGTSYRVNARVGAGRIEVTVPSGVSVRVNAHSGAGNVDIFGRNSSGLGSDTTVTFDYPKGARFVIDLRTGVGSIVVRHRARAGTF